MTTNRRSILSLFLLPVVGLAPAAATTSPTPVTTTAFTCYTCEFSSTHPWPSWECIELNANGSGRTGCKTVGGGGHTECQRSGFLCIVIIITVENDQEAVSDVMAGEDLLVDGNHFFVLDGDDAVVMRTCDLTVVARIPHRQIPGFDADIALATDRA